MFGYSVECEGVGKFALLSYCYYLALHKSVYLYVYVFVFVFVFVCLILEMKIISLMWCSLPQNNLMTSYIMNFYRKLTLYTNNKFKATAHPI